jgi:hypothetical protein
VLSRNAPVPDRPQTDVNIHERVEAWTCDSPDDPIDAAAGLSASVRFADARGRMKRRMIRASPTTPFSLPWCL